MGERRRANSGNAFAGAVSGRGSKPAVTRSW